MPAQSPLCRPCAAFRLGLRPIAAAVLALSAPFVSAQEGGARALSLVPSLTVTESITDNLRLAAAGKSAEAITQLTAALRLSSRSGRVQGNLDYALNGYVYTKDTSASSAQNSLSGNVRIDVVENWLSVTSNAQIGQQTVSAFGTQSSNAGLAGGNTTEVRSWQISPVVHGRLSPTIDYQASATYGIVRTGAAASLGSVDTISAAASVNSDKSEALGWTASLSHRQSDYAASASTELDTAQAALNYRPMHDVLLTASVGRERTNYSPAVKSSTSTWGVSASWIPSTRTKLSANYDHRFFGTGYRLVAEHRFPLSSLRIVSSQDISDASTQPGRSGALGSAYDYFFGQLAAAEPDPAKRDLMVQDILQKNGFSPGAAVAPGFLASGATVQRRTEVSYILQSLRSTLAFNAALSRSSRDGLLAGGIDDLLASNVIHQRIFGLNFGHRLTPTTGISLDLSRQSTLGATAAQSTTLRTLRLGLTTSLGPRMNASLTARHVVFDSSVQPYTENALIAAFGIRF